MNTDCKYSEITESMIGAAYKVCSTFGFGFLE